MHTGYQGGGKEMRRDYFDADVRNVADDEELPVVAISFDGPAGVLSERMNTDDGTLDASEIDVTYRLTDAGGGGETGVLSVANRLTGEFVLEVPLDPQETFSLVRAAKRFEDDDARYRVRLTDGDGKSTIYDKSTLLVYDADGSLLRQKSLIPGGVEL